MESQSTLRDRRVTRSKPGGGLEYRYNKEAYCCEVSLVVGGQVKITQVPLPAREGRGGLVFLFDQ